MRLALVTTAAFTFLCVVVLPGLTHGQDASPRPERRSSAFRVVRELQPPDLAPTQWHQVMDNPYGVATTSSTSRAFVAKSQKRDREISAATKQLRDAANSTQRAEARERLGELLSKD